MSQTTTPSGADVLAAVTAEMRARLVNHRKHTSPTLVAWADKIDTTVAALIARNAELEAERDALRAAAEKAHAFLTHNYWGTWTYMEGSEVYEELREHAELLSDALARTPAKENDDG